MCAGLWVSLSGRGVVRSASLTGPCGSSSARWFFVRFCALCFSLATVLLAQGQPQSALSKSGTGAISGVVRDGRSGAAISGVLISLFGPSGTRQFITDSRGRFVTDQLPSGDYTLAAIKPGFVGAGLVKRRPVMPMAFHLADGEWIADANIEMWRSGVISGTVVDEYGQPVVGVPVRVLTRVPVAGSARWATGAVARTDDRGIYDLSGLGPGIYVVGVPSVQFFVLPGTSAALVQGLSGSNAFSQPLPVSVIESGASWQVLSDYPRSPLRGRAYPPTYFPGTSDFRAAGLIELASGEERAGIDFSIRAVPTAQVSGRIVGPAEVVRAATVRMIPNGATGLGLGSEQATAMIGADGRFVIPGVAVGDYFVDVRVGTGEIGTAGLRLPVTPGFAQEQRSEFLPWLPDPLSANYIVRYVPGVTAYSARQRVAVGSDGVTDLVIPLQRNATISGRVVRDDGQPLSKLALVRVDPATGDPDLGGQASDQPGIRADGSFRIDGLEEGSYFLRAADGAARVKSIVWSGRDFSNQPFDVAAGGDITEAVVTLTTQLASLAGVVHDSRGTVIRRAAIILFPVERESWTSFGITPQRIASAFHFGGHGYRVLRLPAGAYYVIAVDSSLESAWQDPRFFPAAARLATTVTLTWGRETVQDLVLQQIVLK